MIAPCNGLCENDFASTNCSQYFVYLSTRVDERHVGVSAYCRKVQSIELRANVVELHPGWLRAVLSIRPSLPVEHQPIPHVGKSAQSDSFTFNGGANARVTQRLLLQCPLILVSRVEIAGIARMTRQL